MNNKNKKMNINKILEKVKIIKEIQKIILKNLSESQNAILNRKNKQVKMEELIRYDGLLMKYIIKKINYKEEEIIKLCAKYGKIKNIKSLGKRYRYSVDEKAFKNAAAYGNLENMKWMLKKRFTHDEETFAESALNGNLENMKWLLENGFSYDERTYINAAKNGKIENMKWMLENKFPHCETEIFAEAALNGKLENMK